MMILALLCTLFSVVLILLVFLFSKKLEYKESTFKGKVSVLVAARNEEETIYACLHALMLQELPPKVSMEVLVGNDASSDSTAQIVEGFKQTYPAFDLRLLPIEKQIGSAKAKANVLAHLAHEAQGNVFLFTDADVVVNPNWVAGMLSFLGENVGIVTGVTSCYTDSMFGLIQCLDWIYSLSIVKFLSDWKQPVTAMGNNMLVTREAYFKTGGYEKLPFSITEDFQLFHTITGLGYSFKNAFQLNVSALTRGKSTLVDFLHQRKRWMRGAFTLPWHMKSLLFGQMLYYPAIAGLIVIYPALGWALFFSKWVLQTLFLYEKAQTLRLKVSKFQAFWYELSFPVLGLITFVFYLLPTKVEWKGRTY